MSLLASILGFLATLVALAFWVIKDDNWLTAKYLQLVDAYQITAGLSLVILAPLLVIKPLRGLLHPCFATARAVLMFCCWALSFLAVYFIWGSTGVTIGLMLGWVGGVPMAVIACITKGSWTVLLHSVITLIGFIACFVAETITDPSERRNQTQGTIPDSILQASNSIWVCMVLAIPGIIGMTIDQPYGILIAGLVLALFASLAMGVRKGYRIAFVGYAALIIPSVSTYVLAIGDFDMLGILKLDEKALLNLFGSVQTVIAYYALAMLLTPSALKWTWIKSADAGKVKSE
jgi:hypothetical protein